MTDYKNPTPTVDIIIEVDSVESKAPRENPRQEKPRQENPRQENPRQENPRQENKRIVLIRRKNEPHGWALPGGFVDEGETVENAAVREADEETGLKVTLQELLYVYSHPGRDPRQHTMSTVFIATAAGEPRGADDAEEAQLFGRDDVPGDLVFDHERILEHYFKYRQSGERPSPMAELERFHGAKPTID